MNRFVMRIESSFVMADGRTFLVGEVSSGPEGGRFTARRCEVTVDRHTVQVIQIENEEFPEQREASSQRVFATKDPLIVSAQDFTRRECIVREVEAVGPAN